MIIVTPPEEELDRGGMPDARMYAPELLIPNRKPVGQVEMDESNPFTKDMLFYGIVVPGGLYDVVSENFYSLPNAVITTRNGELVADYNGGTWDSITLANKIPWIPSDGADGNRSYGARTSRNSKGNNGDATNHVQIISDAPVTTETVFFGTAGEFSPAPSPYRPDIYFYVSFGQMFQTFDDETLPHATLQNTSASAFMHTNGSGSPESLSRAFQEGVFFQELTLDTGTPENTIYETMILGNDADADASIADVSVSAFWIYAGFLSDAEQAEFDKNIYQVLKPRQPSLDAFRPPTERRPVIPDSRMAAPELLIPGRKPTGEVEVDRGNPYGKHVALCVLEDRDIVSNTLIPRTLVGSGSRGNLLWYEILGAGTTTITFPVELTQYTILMFVKSHGWLSTLFTTAISGTDASSNSSFRIRSTPTSPLAHTIFNVGGGNGDTTLEEDLTVPIAMRASESSVHTRDVDGGVWEDNTGNGRRALNLVNFFTNTSEVAFESFIIFDKYFTEGETEKLILDPYQVLKPAIPLDVHQPVETGFWLPDSRMEAPELFIPNRKPVAKMLVDTEHPLAQDAIGYWTFGRTNRFKDLIGGNDAYIDGTGTDVALNPEDVHIADNDEKYVRIDDPDDIYKDDTTGMSITIRLNPKTANGFSRLVETRGSGWWGSTGGWNLMWDSGNNTLSSATGDTGANITWSPSRDLQNEWYWFTIMSDGTTASFYVDGEFADSDTLPFDVGSMAGHPITFGYYAYEATDGEAAVSDMIIHKRVLSDAEIIQLHTNFYQFLIPE